MNKLYGILLGTLSIPEAYSWYAKNYTAVPISDKGTKIRNMFLSSLDTDKVIVFICVVCYFCLLSNYGVEIKKLDENNTYVAPVRPTDEDSSSAKYCVYDLIKPAAQYEDVISYLDDDIRETLDTESFISIAGAVSLQLLREAII